MATDCEWVVERCKEQIFKNNKGSAKAWILTARSLYPDNFAVQVVSVVDIRSYNHMHTYTVV